MDDDWTLTGTGTWTNTSVSEPSSCSITFYVECPFCGNLARLCGDVFVCENPECVKGVEK